MWEANQRGLAPADLAMHVALPELDGRIHAGAIAFKSARPADDALGFGGMANRPEPDRVEQVADRVAAFLRLQATPRAERRLAVLIPDYPAAAGRSGYAVGLDVPASVLAILHDLAAAGYRVEGIPDDPRALLRLLERRGAKFELSAYRSGSDTVDRAWSDPLADPDVDGGAFRFRAASLRQRDGGLRAGSWPGERPAGRLSRPGAAAPPCAVAFGQWLRQALGLHALVHVGAHGTLEWLPGKTVALSAACFPEQVAGPLPVVYPFIVSNPGEAAQAKRRIAAVTIGHLPPPLAWPASIRSSRRWSAWSTNTCRPTASTAAAATGWRG